MEANDWHKKETYKSLIHYGTSSIKFVFLVNSGAIIALLTFLGTLLEKNSLINTDIKFAFYYFVGGIVSSGIATTFAYLTQLKLYNESKHQVFLYISMFFVLIGIVLFCLGSLSAIESLIGCIHEL
ncbi:hypothetical protein CRU94_04005 [Arcobacter sp. AHV-9/2010]|uniref:hypothetical protein n=1 Tax=Arcobacter sp. AHV-9/2010 TaxID=2021861 RepID=UPI00100A67BB|nr:hypothetical protein [Arcobacter sp. CECT 9299]RXJ95787.1 hypothetical protein CRU94_04005 [Arcobacter sp. CECT 9299]